MSTPPPDGMVRVSRRLAVARKCIMSVRYDHSSKKLVIFLVKGSYREQFYLSEATGSAVVDLTMRAFITDYLGASMLERILKDWHPPNKKRRAD